MKPWKTQVKIQSPNGFKRETTANGYRTLKENHRYTYYDLYRKSKGKIKEESIYSNNYGSILLFKCRTNTLNLNDRNRFVSGNTECPGCSCDKEDLHHFLLVCPLYSNIRGEFTQLQQPYIEDTDEVLARLLLFHEQPIEAQLEVQRYLCKIYHKRKKQLEN